MNLNMQAIRILFLKDLFLSRRYLFGYFASGVVSSLLACLPNPTFAFIGFILVMTVAIASGIHLIGLLLLAESTDHTRLFVMSLPVSLLDYSIGKISVVLTTYLLPWSAMFVCTTILAFVLPWAKDGSAVVLPAIFSLPVQHFHDSIGDRRRQRVRGLDDRRDGWLQRRHERVLDEVVC